MRFSRDKRGYEHTYLVHEAGGRGKPARARVLYWFRTPPGIKVGREPFDQEARRQIESQNPGISFDWNALASTPMPPIPEVEHWRERRRLERAAKVARRHDEDPDEPPDAETVVAEAEAAQPAPAPVPEPVPAGAAPQLPGDGSEPAAGLPAEAESPRKRRRRRGGRRRRAAGDPAISPGIEGGATDFPASNDEPEPDGGAPPAPVQTAAGQPSSEISSETVDETSQE